MYTILILLFTAGVIAEALLLSYRKEIDFGRLKGVFILSLVLLFFSFFAGVDSDAGPEAYYIMFVIFFSIVFAITFRNEILPVINEGTILSFTIVFWFVLLENFNYFCIPLVAIAVIASIGTLVLAFTKIKIGFYSSVFFYGWFLIMSLFIGVMQVLYFFVDKPSISGIDAFVFGMLFLYLMANYIYIFMLISVPPFPNPATFSKDIKNWKRDMQYFAVKYSKHQMPLPVSLLIIIIEGGTLLLNYLYNFIPLYFLVALFIVVPSQIAPVITNLSKKN